MRKAAERQGRSSGSGVQAAAKRRKGRLLRPALVTSPVDLEGRGTSRRRRENSGVACSPVLSAWPRGAGGLRVPEPRVGTGPRGNDPTMLDVCGCPSTGCWPNRGICGFFVDVPRLGHRGIAIAGIARAIDATKNLARSRREASEGAGGRIPRVRWTGPVLMSLIM